MNLAAVLQQLLMLQQMAQLLQQELAKIITLREIKRAIMLMM